MLDHSRLLSSPVVALAAALAASCSESPTTLTETERDAPPPSLDLENAPATSGPFIVRFESGFSVGFTDSDRELLALHQLDDSLLGCRQATAESERLTVQAILEPDGPVQFLVRSDATFTAVFDLTELTAIPTDPEELCDFLLGLRAGRDGSQPRKELSGRPRHPGGRQAGDLIMVDGDPLEDLVALWKVKPVVKGGEVVFSR